MVLRIWRSFCGWLTMVLILALSSASTCHGKWTTADWLPADTKFHFSIVNYPASKPLFEQTGLGQLLEDEAMRPFLKDFPSQLRTRARTSWLGFMWVDVGVDWDRFVSVPSGEVAWAVLNVDETPAAILLADVSGKDDEVERLRGEMAAAMAKQNVTPQQQDVNGTTLTIYALPKRGELEATTLIHFVHNGFFVATRNLELAKRIAPRIGQQQPDNLRGLATYQHVLGECRRAAKQDPHATLYMVPFDCLELIHKVAAEKEVEMERPPQVYRSQGFDCALGHRSDNSVQGARERLQFLRVVLRTETLVQVDADD